MMDQIEKGHERAITGLKNESDEMMKQVEREKEIYVRNLQDDLLVVQKELDDSKVANAEHTARLQGELVQCKSRAEAAEASFSAAEANQRHLHQIIRDLEEKIKKAEEATSRTAAEAEAKEAHIKGSVKDKLQHEFSQYIKRGLIEIHKSIYKTESFATELEVEFAKYSTQVYKAHKMEVAALERQLFATTSKAEV